MTEALWAPRPLPDPGPDAAAVVRWQPAGPADLTRGRRELAAHLETALTSRATIDQAKGVVMARLGVSADEAFTRLVAISNRLNVKLRDLAGLVLEGHLDALVRAAE